LQSVPYGETNIVGPGQTPRVMRGVFPGHTLFFANEHLQRAYVSLPEQY